MSITGSGFTSLVPGPLPRASGSTFMQPVGSQTLFTPLPHSSCLTESMATTFQQTVNQAPKIPGSYAPNAGLPFPCPEQIGWQPKFLGCPTQFVSEPSMKVELNPLGPRYGATDLNEYFYQRQLMLNPLPNPYQYMHSRQALVQFLAKDLPQNKDPQTRRIQTFQDSAAFQMQTRGPPAFVRF